MASERLPFRALINKNPNHAAMNAQTVREYDYDKDVFIKRIKGMSEKEFNSFCNQILNWQHFAYKIRGTVGTDSKENIPPEQRNLFKQYQASEKHNIKLPEEDDNDEDPGIIIQKCMRSHEPRDMIIHIIQTMGKEDFQDFCTDIELLAYFDATQGGSYFSHYPELISPGDDRFWFND